MMDTFEKAFAFAINKHSGQTRKMSGIPYILHPAEVAAIVGSMTGDREVLSAAVLHDTVEDTDTTLEEIEENFGRRVALLVMTETEEKREDRPPAETWQLRKEETLLILQNTKDEGVRMMWLGDKLSNMRSFKREFEKHGDAIWEGMNQKDPKMQAWYYASIAKYLSSLSEYPAYKEYVDCVNTVFREHLDSPLEIG